MAYKNKKSTFLSVNGCTARTAHFGYKDISLCVWTGNVQAFFIFETDRAAVNNA